MADGAFVLSFDFELAWGMRDRLDGSQRLDSFCRVQDEIIPALLAILCQYEIPATWATVGHLMLHPHEDTARGHLHPDADLHLAGLSESDLKAFYAPRAIEAILSAPTFQELAAHSFSHPMFDEAVCSPETARRELDHLSRAAETWNQRPTSFVFPRNALGHLDLVRQAGYRAFRGPNAEWYWFGRPWAIYSRPWLRMPVWLLRYVDEQLALCPPLPPVRRTADMWEIPHSMFFPGWRGVSRWVRPQRQVIRATKGLEQAAQRRRVFSLFTHPHNFVQNRESQIAAFEAICQQAARLRDANQLETLTMCQMADRLDAGQADHWLSP